MIQFSEITFDLQFKMAGRCWTPEHRLEGSPPFLLIHGLASNAQTWNKVGRILAEQGYLAIAIDQRNHGQSQPTESGFDFETVTADLNQLLDQLGWKSPILVGQSWGGNVLTAFGARYPKRAKGLVMVDGGFLDLSLSGDPWETVYKKMLPTDVSHVSVEMMRQLIQLGHPDWDDEGIDVTLANLRVKEDGLLERPLPIDKHMQIVRHLFDQDLKDAYQKISDPVLICAAGSGAEPDPLRQKMLDNATQISNVQIDWFENSDHDLHIQKPEKLTKLMIEWLNQL